MSSLYNNEVLPFCGKTGADKNAEVRHNNYKELQLLNIDEVCVLLQIKRTKLYDLLNRGSLRAVKQGKRTLFRSADVRRYINLLEEYGG